MKIDYKQIEQDFPKAFAVFKESMYYRILEPDGYVLFDDRDLYDFFDEKHLYLLPYRFLDNTWVYTIDDTYCGAIVSNKHYHTRTEAEAGAFYAAFKLLEETL